MFVCTCDENNSRTGNFNTYICQYLYDTITYMYIHHIIIILYVFAPISWYHTYCVVKAPSSVRLCWGIVKLRSYNMAVTYVM